MMLEQQSQAVEKSILEQSEATSLKKALVPTSSRIAGKDDDYRLFFNQVVQPALEGLMDGSLSTLAPIFITIFMTRHTLSTFFVGAGAALAAGISELFSESLSDDENFSERGKPIVHASITAFFTFISGLILALPFLIPNYRLSLNIAYVVVVLELAAVSVLRAKFLSVKWWLSALQVVGGGVIVFIAALVLGNA